MHFGKGLMSCLHTGYLTVGALAVGQQCRAAAGLRVQRWPPFFGRLGRTQEHDRKARPQWGNGAATDEGDLRRIPASQ